MTKNPSSENARKFRQLAEKRVTKAIKAIRLIGNLSNKSNYSYTDDEAKKIISALQDEILTIKKRFNDSGNSNEVNFKL